MQRAGVLAVLLAACLVLGAHAQRVLKAVTIGRTTPQSCQWSYRSLYYARSAIVGDVDGDGVNDLLLAHPYVTDAMRSQSLSRPPCAH